MTDRVGQAGMQVAFALAEFVERRALPGTGVPADRFWTGLAAIMAELGPENRALLARRDELQSQIDDRHIAKAGFALNAANARRGSLHDALYGTDALGDRPAGGPLDPARAARVVAWVRAHLDRVAPLAGASWADVAGLAVVDGALRIDTDAGPVGLADPGQFAGWLHDTVAPLRILLRVNGLLIEIRVDRAAPTGACDRAGISDVLVEAALSTIMDFEDSVAVVDAADKVQAYGNWLGLPPLTIKLGLMDEERRTSVNLRACIHAARDRIFFVNTGFLDCTGDEIHTAMEAGPVVPKEAMRSQAWIRACEDRNVDIALAAGLAGRGQIGKGMWTRPDDMAAMLADKIAHPCAGASCAWVPSPAAAELHATHYHLVDVAAWQAAMAAGGPRATLDDLLTLPLIEGNGPSTEVIRTEVENDVRGILGYVVRWVDQGIGCSKVPDLHDIPLMEDRATCRISAQGLANWLHHGLVSEADVMAALHKMALVVDRQNAADPAYVPMAPAYDGLAFRAACDLVFRGRIQPSGCTEPVLHRRRIERKARAPV